LLFDSAVWSKDLESSPSPFPMTLLLRSNIPCIDTPEEVTGSPLTSLPQSSMSNVDQGSTATSNIESDAKQDLARDSLQITAASRDSSQTTSLRGSLGRLSNASNVSLSHSLVRIPDDVQRRTSIRISFEAVMR